MLLCPPMAACWAAVGKKGGLKDSGFSSGNGKWKWKCMDISVLSQTTPCWHRVLCLCCKQGEDLFLKSPYHCQCLIQERPAQGWTAAFPFCETVHSRTATAIDFRGFLELEIPLMDIPASPLQPPCVLTFKTPISISLAWPWPCSCATSKVSAALQLSKTTVSSQEWWGDAD